MTGSTADCGYLAGDGRHAIGGAGGTDRHTVLRRAASFALIGVLVPLLMACALPRSAAMPAEVLRGTEAEDSGVQVIAVTRASINDIATWPNSPALARRHWVTTGASPVARLIRAGDRISLAVWDSQRDSLLSTEQERVVNIENVAVSSSGDIFIPYIGEFRIAGQTSDRARREIQSRLEAIVPDAQVQIVVEPGAGNTIDLVGGVARPGRLALPDISPTLMSVLAEAGGVDDSLRNPMIRLQRAGQSYTIPAAELLADPGRDTALRGGDRIVVEADTRNYIALGATGTQQVVYFERERINALDALSTIGGFSQQRADISGLMVLREYAENQVRPGPEAPDETQVIFTFDLRNADGLFAARRFEIMPDDVVLATESVIPAFTQVMALFRGISSTATDL